VSHDLLHALGIDPEDPEVAAAIADAELAGNLMDALVERRLALGLTLHKLDELLDWRCGSSAAFERMGGDPTVSELQRYARALGLRLDLALVEPGQDQETNAVTQFREPEQMLPIADSSLLDHLDGERTP
jgi:transcriptional regulator with XRE-family HTH domain